MCGINGIFAYHSAASPPTDRELVATRDAMRARGPDGSAVWWSPDRRCGLGHRRLSLLDLSERASQTMTSEDGRFVVVFNGEIYNYPELRAELEAGEAQFRTSCDTEILFAPLRPVWRQHGASAARHVCVCDLGYIAKRSIPCA